MQFQRPRICVTGMGAFVPGSENVNSFMQALYAGRPSFSIAPEEPEIRLGEVLVGRCPDPLIQACLAGKGYEQWDRVIALSVVAANEAVAQAGLSPAQLKDAGIVWATGAGGVGTTDKGYIDLWFHKTRKLRPESIANMMTSAATFFVAHEFGIEGPSQTISSACASSSLSILDAVRMLERGEIECALVGGVESGIFATSRKAWKMTTTLCRIDADAPETSVRPFAADRSGFALAEGAGCLVLETEQHALARKAKVLGWIRGFAQNTDPGHIMNPSLERERQVMQRALVAAGITANEIAYINGHATATKLGDLAEGRAILEVFGSKPLVGGTKCMHGHLLGAAGVTEALITLSALNARRVPGNPFSENLDPALQGLNVPTSTQTLSTKEAPLGLSNSFAFGGVNTAIVLQAGE